MKIGPVIELRLRSVARTDTRSNIIYRFAFPESLNEKTNQQFFANSVRDPFSAASRVLQQRRLTLKNAKFQD